MASQLSPFSKEELMPQPEMLEVRKNKNQLYIGLPKETHYDEKRICLTPTAVEMASKMIKNAAPEYPIVLLFNDANLRIILKKSFGARQRI